MTRIKFLVAAALATALSGCSTSSLSYVEDKSSYSVVRGHVTRVVNLSTSKVEPLSDGVAVTVNGPNCHVIMKFEDGRKRQYALGSGVILVIASDYSYILESQAGN